MVVDVIDGVVNETPVVSAVPPVAAEYQLTVPISDAAARSTVPVPQRDAGVAPVIDGIVFTVAVTAVLEAVVQLAVLAST